jgi:serine protease Do
MKQLFSKLGAAAIAALLFIPAVNAQDEKVKEEKKETPKDVERIIVTRKGDNKEKVTIVVDGDNITVNGKPISELKDGDITVNKSKYKTGSNVLNRQEQRLMAWSDDAKAWNLFNTDENRAMLGVVTEKTDGGVKISDVTKESAAEKAGLKEGDVITKIGDKKIETSDDLSKEIKSHKPGEKVSVTYLRDKKENKATAELTKSKAVNAFAFGEGQNYDFKMPEMKFKEFEMPNGKSLPRARVYGDMLNLYGGGQPRLGLSVQDTDDGKGVKVLEVDEESNAAKAGVKENDIVTHVNDKEVNSADEVAKLVKENKDKPSMRLQIKRDGKSQNIEVKMPRKLKTADL